MHTFLPALSGFYATYVGKQRYPDPVKGPYVPMIVFLITLQWYGKS